MGDMNIHITWLTHVRTEPKKKIASVAQGGSDKVRIARDVIYIFEIPNDHVRQLLL